MRLSGPPLAVKQSTGKRFLYAIILLGLAYFGFLLLFTHRPGLPKDLNSEFADEFAIFWKSYDKPSLRAAFYGPWIPAGLKDPIRNFYRPVAIAAYAGLYEIFGNDTSSLYEFRQYLSLVKLISLFGIFYFLAGESMLVACIGTFLYSISFKIFEEQVFFQGIPDLLTTTFFFAAVLLFLLYSRRTYSTGVSAGSGALICILFLLCLGTKESGLFLFPTLVVFRMISVWNRNVSFAKNVNEAFRRKYLILFSVMGLISSTYFVVRFYALGAQYVFTGSWEMQEWPPLLYSLINLVNSFAFIPQTYIDHSFADDWWTTGIKTGVNLLLPAAGIYLCFQSNVSSQIKKSIAFALTLVVMNTFFYTQGIRVRFNAIGNLGSFFLAAILCQRTVVHVLKSNRSVFSTGIACALLLAGVYFYTILNVWNVMHRSHPFHPTTPLTVGIFDLHHIFQPEEEKTRGIEALNTMNIDAAGMHGADPNFSFFLLASNLQSAHRTLDCFDLSFRGFRRGPTAEIQLQSVEKKEESIKKQAGYRREFGLGLVNAAFLLLKPKQAFEERGADWATGFDMHAFRQDMETAKNHFRESGPIGANILKQLDQVSRKIDESQDGQFSDEEIERFLGAKLVVLKENK